ncbi:MAG: DUF4292 domain-containing protein [Saprospiraceae bacterium]|nr:DUF4292 domain-containing protein [Saprospiraceae bacterium]
MKAIMYLVFLLILFSCGTSRRLITAPLPERTKSDIYTALVNRNIDFKWFSGRMSTELDSPDEHVSGSMAIRMKKDSLIWVVVKKFGIEAARVLIDREKYTVLYRLESMYETSPVSKLNELFSVAANFDDMQQLIFGNVILADSSSMMIRKDSIYYIAEATHDDLHLKYYVNGYTMELDKMAITDKMNRTAQAMYSDYKHIGRHGKVSFDRTLIFPYNDEHDASINIRFSEMDIDVAKEFKFSIPESYEKIN